MQPEKTPQKIGGVVDSSVIRVVLIEDQRELREGLRMLLNATPGYRCINNFSSMEEALKNIERELPDIVLTDIGLPGMSGIEGIGLLKERYPELVIVALTVFDDDDRIFNALCAGASGYLLKKTPPARLLEGLKEVNNGGAAMSPEVALRVIRLFRDVRPPERGDCHLTPQETQLLKLLVEGHNYKTAASEMEVSVNTVSFHLRNIYRKLQVHSKSEAVAKALRNQLI